MIQILQGDCREVMKTLEADSIHAVVTDPPYELTSARPGGRSEATRGAVMGGFMGMKWDGTGVAFDPATWVEVLRVLKPGAHLLAFGGTRTHHRMMCAIEDAGFELRDCLGWLFGQGFPKSKNLDGDWKGWGSALKPAWEPIIMARKPFAGTIADNVLAHGAGAINIDGCRIEFEDTANPATNPLFRKEAGYKNKQAADLGSSSYSMKAEGSELLERNISPLGRWPANILHDGSEQVLAIFPSEAGAAAPVTTRNGDKFRNSFGKFKGDIDEQGSTFHGDAGSAARFFYCSKVGRAERDVGLQGFDKKVMNWSSGEKSPGTFQSENTDRSARNHHPTVKPVELMRYLIRLITPPGGTVLDCFAGSGSTLRAADIEGFDAIGIEMNPEYIEIAKARVDGDMPLFAEVKTA